MRTEPGADTLEMALWTRERAGLPAGAGLVHHHDNGSQYVSFAFTQRLIDAGVDASVGSVGDAYDNALAETTIGLFKTEKIRREGPWKTLADVELATLEWVDWFNNARLHSACGRLSPAQLRARVSTNTSNPMETGRAPKLGSTSSRRRANARRATCACARRAGPGSPADPAIKGGEPVIEGLARKRAHARRAIADGRERARKSPRTSRTSPLRRGRSRPSTPREPARAAGRLRDAARRA